MDKNLEHLKNNYQEIPIPAELDFVVKKAIRKHRTKRTNLRWIMGTAAAVIVFVSGVNSSPTFANAFSDIPVLNNIVKVITFREYKVDEDTYNADLKVPAVTNLENKKLEEMLNKQYLEENKQLYEDFKKDMEAMKQEGSGGHLGIDSGYEVKTDNEQILSIGRYVVNTVGSSSTTIKYDTIDKKNQVLITLPSLFKDDTYVTTISQIIKEQMNAQMKSDPDKFYWVEGAPDMDSMETFTTIQKDQSFYINTEGKLVISFDKYVVAPGYMGVVEFVIPTEKIAADLVSSAYIK
ncbi:anti-sigma factor [Paenibacillus selenitireducens]|uniref:Anti-sigma factor n=1 Tax=Paenibacillus selenitireducens TaxID=1324314 RepID=A0A1T2X5Y2_9BACL|nr:anti-sigma-V factor rsiV [Paenibacillus selenitireducens]OPA75287.1 anti-sigma factor [Paenibacillus selenitireducens]